MDEAEEVARIVDQHGLCLVRCGELGGDLVAFIKDERFRPKVPNDGFVVYGLLELELVEGLPIESLRRIHQAKVFGGEGAKVTDVVPEAENENE